MCPPCTCRCSFASTGYFGGCACEGGGTYKCNRLLGMCVRSKTGSLSEPECEASCGVTLTTVEAAAAA